MNYNILKKAILFFAGVMILASCTDGFDNNNPSGVNNDEIDRDGYKVANSMRTLSNYVVFVDANGYQFSECLMDGNYGRYFADANPGFNGKNFATFQPEDHWLQYVFNNITPNVFTNHKAVKDATTDPVYLAVADVIKVMAMHRVADTYGPIPYSQIGADGKMEAPYDSEKELYESMILTLTEAANTLAQYQTQNFSANTDNIYNGNTLKWAKLANSIKLRLAMRISNIVPDYAKKMAEEAVNSSVGVINSVDESAYKTAPVQNPLYAVLQWNGGESKIAADLLAYMNTFNDPRRAVYFTESQFPGYKYVGLRSGILIPGTVDVLHKYSMSNVKQDDKILLMNAAEVDFLRAEGALKGWSMGGDVVSLYNSGIEKSFLQAKLSTSEAQGYASNTLSNAITYTDPTGAYSYPSAIANLSTALSAADSKDVQLEKIIVQKWIANYPLGNESWCDNRRTGFPKFMPVVLNASGGGVPQGQLASRVTYPNREYTENPTNVRNAVQQYLGADTQGTKLWWAKK